MKKIPLKTKIFAFLGALWIRSLRIKFHAPEDFRPGVLGLWHKDLLASCATFKDKGVHVLISESSDGEIFAGAANRLGYKVTRGSDTSGATNVRHLFRTLRSNGYVGMALDGPHGPALEVKPGSIWLAKTCKKPLWHIVPKYGAHFTLKTWDKFIVPLPLSTIDIEIKYLCNEDGTTQNL